MKFSERASEAASWFIARDSTQSDCHCVVFAQLIIALSRVCAYRAARERGICVCVERTLTRPAALKRPLLSSNGAAAALASVFLASKGIRLLLLWEIFKPYLTVQQANYLVAVCNKCYQNAVLRRCGCSPDNFIFNSSLFALKLLLNSMLAHTTLGASHKQFMCGYNLIKTLSCANINGGPWGFVKEILLHLEHKNFFFLNLQ